MLLAGAQQTLPLYGNDPIPNAKQGPDKEVDDSSKGVDRMSITLVSHPTLSVFLPPKEKATGTAIIVCPGGSYSHLAMGHEGIEVARWLNGIGVAAFVLKYRLPSDETMVDKRIGPLQDAQRAIQLVRERAAEWGVNPARVGIMGFSAGGHLASSAGTHFGKSYIASKNNISLRPDFQVLLYPVISFSDSIGHRGSRDNLIGKAPNPTDIQEYSNELQVTAQTPPAFLVQSEDDKTVKAANTIHFYEALLQNKIPAELHMYPLGGHGYGMHNTTTKDLWPDRLKNWLDANGWLGAASR